MIVLNNMGLIEWNEITDSFSHEQLAANWRLVDEHNHTSGKGVQIPSGGIETGAITAAKIGTEAVETSKIKNLAVTDAKLESPTNGVWRTIHFGGGAYPSSTAGTKYFLNSGGALGAATGTAARLFFFSSTDYSVNGKTLKLRMRAQQRTVAAGPATTLTVGLYKVTAISSNNLTVEAAAVAGSTVAFASTASNTLAQGNSGAFAAPSEGQYVFGVANSGTTAASSEHGLSFQLQFRHE